MLPSLPGGLAKWKEMRGDLASCQPCYCGVRMRGAVLESTSVSSIVLLYCQEDSQSAALTLA